MSNKKSFILGFLLGGLIVLVIARIWIGAPVQKELTPIKGVNLVSLNKSGEAGVAILTEEGSKVRIRISVANSPVNVPQPAHIHLGSCPNPGTIKFPLNDVVNGISETVINATFAELKVFGPIAINIHKSVTEAGTYVSCGNIKL